MAQRGVRPLATLLMGRRRRRVRDAHRRVHPLRPYLPLLDAQAPLVITPAMLTKHRAAHGEAIPAASYQTPAVLTGTAQLTARVPPSHRAPSTSLRDGSRGAGPLRACAAHTRARRASCTRSTHNGGVMHGGTAPPSRASRRAPTGTAPAHPPSAPGYLPAPHRARRAEAQRQRGGNPRAVFIYLFFNVLSSANK